MKRLFDYLRMLFPGSVSNPVDPLDSWSRGVVIRGLHYKPFRLHRMKDGNYKVNWLAGKPERPMREVWEPWRVKEVQEGSNKAFYVETFDPRKKYV